MQSNHIRNVLWAVAALTGAAPALGSVADHREFDATLHAPYQGDKPDSDARTFTLTFDYPFSQTALPVNWRVELLSPSGKAVQQWRGALTLKGQPATVNLKWEGRRHARGMPDGVYRVRLHAQAHGDVIEQGWDIAVGRLAAAAMPPFRAMSTGPASTAARGPLPPSAAPAAASLPFTVYFANLHSQTNHSDGGGDLGNCKGAQAPQAGAQGPLEAYAYAHAHGLDVLMASEHNHMYDGSDGSNPEASAGAARALYQRGLKEAASFSKTNPGFLAMYGMEWGVINNGGHLNIFNAPELLGWERDAKGEPIGDTITAKGDYRALYSLMRERGWVGQFNHPALGGQFLVDGVAMGYTKDGDEAMALCEVLNTSAFSTKTGEDETRRSNYEIACNKALEAGYHVAFSSNQDNHCANWGASYTNRTGVLIPNGTALTQASFIDALKARRVFATMDKNSQLVLTANGQPMGSRIANSGPLRLIAHYANTEGRSVASVSIIEGVPGRNGTVSEAAATAEATLTPSPGEHFYYARITQDDGKILWSAPIWVTQVPD
ncbi:CehA/McbA family metallohydrolase [Massilia soli]|uniref:CehA/McbA family metallohydrolase n=1 Tax=Massilia soli TaxID=2792854 RepID=A0ABS7SIC1_9BURK|nr:CehA/McbA family metallohydrolase [Massilia soli]MBZ2205956.1 CehA/McbA family metallohydrolase [Massilia soli]